MAAVQHRGEQFGGVAGRFGTGVLPTKDTTVQHEDTVYVAAVSGTVSDVTAAAAAPPEED